MNLEMLRIRQSPLGAPRPMLTARGTDDESDDAADCCANGDSRPLASAPTAAPGMATLDAEAPPPLLLLAAADVDSAAGPEAAGAGVAAAGDMDDARVLEDAAIAAAERMGETRCTANRGSGSGSETTGD
jgi:hypothetical protein